MNHLSQTWYIRHSTNSNEVQSQLRNIRCGIGIKKSYFVGKGVIRSGFTEQDQTLIFLKYLVCAVKYLRAGYVTRQKSGPKGK